MRKIALAFLFLFTACGNNETSYKSLASAETVYKYVQYMNQFCEHKQYNKDYSGCVESFISGYNYNAIPDELASKIRETEEKMLTEAKIAPQKPDIEDAERLDAIYVANLKSRGLTDDEIDNMDNVYNKKDPEGACRIIIETGKATIDMGENDGGNYAKLLYQ